METLYIHILDTCIVDIVYWIHVYLACTAGIFFLTIVSYFLLYMLVELTILHRSVKKLGKKVGGKVVKKLIEKNDANF